MQWCTIDCSPILPRLSGEGCTLVVLELAHMVVKSHHHCVKVTSSCNLASQRLPELMNKNAEYSGEQEDKSIICMRMT